MHLKLTRLELTIERSYQTHSRNKYLQITRSVRRFLLRRNFFSSKMQYHIAYDKAMQRKRFFFSSP